MLIVDFFFVFIVSTFIDPEFFSLGVLENCQWDVSKPDIQIFLPHMFMEGCGEGDGFFISTVVDNTLIDFKAVPQVLQV